MTNDRGDRQLLVAEWCAAAFGAAHQASVEQRAVRFLEEAIELFQACVIDHVTREEDSQQTFRGLAHRLVDYVFDRPPGMVCQELGGVGLTTLALAAAAGLHADECEAAEIARVLAKPLAHFHARNEVKNAAGFDVTGGAYPTGRE